jgi:WD40 repeat protein
MRSATKDFLLEPMAVAFAPDGKSILAGGADKTISIIDPESDKVTRAFPKQPGLVWLLDVSADGKQAAAVYRSAERFLDINQLALWDLAKGTAIADFQKPGVTIVGGAFVGDHYLFTAASGNELTVWSIQ